LTKYHIHFEKGSDLQINIIIPSYIMPLSLKTALHIIPDFRCTGMVNYYEIVPLNKGLPSNMATFVIFRTDGLKRGTTEVTNII
jgi:hypothetical protein